MYIHVPPFPQLNCTLTVSIPTTSLFFIVAKPRLSINVFFQCFGVLNDLELKAKPGLVKTASGWPMDDSSVTEYVRGALSGTLSKVQRGLVSRLHAESG